MEYLRICILSDDSDSVQLKYDPGCYVLERIVGPFEPWAKL